MEKNLRKPYLINSNLLRGQDLWQAHYQMLLIIFLRELITLNTNMDMTTKSKKHVVLNTKIVRDALNTHTLKMI